jgi:protein-tyrosine phosphatase
MTAPRTILFICAGNTCRSPMAEAIAQHWIDQGNLPSERRYLAVSAGVSAAGNVPVSRETIAVLESLGIEHEGRSKPLTAEMIRHAEVVLCMTRGQAATARSLVADEPQHLKKIHMLDPNGEVDDPIGSGQKAYDDLAQRFRQLIPKRLKEILGHEDRTGVGSSRREGG